MAASARISERIVSAAMDLAATKGWRSLSLVDIANKAGVSLVDIYQVFQTKTAILNAAIAEVDRQILAGSPPDMEETVRDRLFDVLMRRFDMLSPRKQAITAIARDLPRDPLALLATLPRLANSMAWMLETAGLSSEGPAGLIRIKALATIYMATLRDWLKDDSADLAPTMAALDRRLRRVESLVPEWRFTLPCPFKHPAPWCSSRDLPSSIETSAKT